MILDFIRDRVKDQNLDRDNKPLPKYSEAYIKSLNFKIAGKSPGDVNMTQSGDTLGAMTLLSHERGTLLLGFEKGSQENAIADGNIRGTYGNSKSTGKKRPFLGLTERDLASIVQDFAPQIEGGPVKVEYSGG